MLSIFFDNGAKDKGNQVELYVAHFTSGQAEQNEFLKFYSDKEVITGQ